MTMMVLILGADFPSHKGKSRGMQLLVPGPLNSLDICLTDPGWLLQFRLHSSVRKIKRRGGIY